MAILRSKSERLGRQIPAEIIETIARRVQSNIRELEGSLTRVLALELGRYNILVNAVAPGLIETPLTGALPADVLEKLIQAQPTKTMGKPEDIANAVSFLASEKTQFITGQVIYVDGGKSIGANLSA